MVRFMVAVPPVFPSFKSAAPKGTAAPKVKAPFVGKAPAPKATPDIPIDAGLVRAQTAAAARGPISLALVEGGTVSGAFQLLSQAIKNDDLKFGCRCWLMI